MKKLTAIASTLLCGAVLAACQPAEPTVFGVRESVWKTLSPQEKKQVIKGYNETQKINAKNAPLESAIGATSAAVQNKQNMDWQRDQEKDMPQIHMPSGPSMPNMGP